MRGHDDGGGALSVDKSGHAIRGGACIRDKPGHDSVLGERFSKIPGERALDGVGLCVRGKSPR